MSQKTTCVIYDEEKKECRGLKETLCENCTCGFYKSKKEYEMDEKGYYSKKSES